MNYLTADQVLFIHYRLISETGGKHGVNDPTGLASILRHALASQEETQSPHALFRSAANLLTSLVNTSFFSDGNLATAIAVTDLFLRVNGYRLAVDQQSLQDVLVKIKQGDMGKSQIERWLSSHACS
ncbi:MAG TPA: type II toxin-antitoxin system death-on-curing family toxin [Anaerolineales bacterium]|nr:type II toxin-antitoxin system death-on-curing family toxin [Anaerolineales bacterium]